MIIADSDVLIDALRGRRTAVEHIDRALESGSLATTAITAFELSSGARSLRAAEKVQALLAALRILPLDEIAAERAAQVRRDLEAAGTPIGMADYLIAGICLQRSATLLTRNRGHFARVPGLELGPVFPGD
jgi:tRNA(fMet)-specific endonuclease VapC